MSDISDFNQRTGANVGGGFQPEQPRDLKDQARAFGNDLKNKAADFGDTVAQATREQAAGFKQAAQNYASDASEKVASAMREQKSAGADYINGIAQAVHRAAGEFDREIPQASQYIHKAAEQMESLAETVRQRDPRELMGEVQDFARRQPTLFFGGAMLLGFAALRFLKSAEPQGSDRFATRRQGV
jgi:hypothetical protein